MRIFLSCLGLLLAAGCIAGIVAIAITLDHTMNVPIVVPDAAPACPDCPVTPTPEPKPEPKPDKRKPWGPHGNRPVGTVSVEQMSMPYAPQAGGLTHDGPTHNGQEVQIDLPADLLKRNIASKGLGCCVFRSANYIGLYHNIPELIDLPEKMKAAGVPGGGWPEKYDEIMKRFAPDYRYLQVTNGDWEIVKKALKMGRCVEITFQPAHMVNIVKLENGVGCFRDNNLTGPSELIWGSEEAIKQKSGGKSFWAVIPLHGRPPAPPRSGKQSMGGTVRRVHSSLVAERLPGRYSWDEVVDDEQWLLYHDGRQVGAFVPEWDCYRERLGPGQWGKTWRRPPVPIPEEAMAKLEAMPAGVQMQNLGQRECYSLCGQEITRAQAEAALEDDSAKLSFTAIGSKAETARVRADLDRPEMAAFKSHVIFQEYEPTNWAVSPERFGFDVSGHPTVYLEDAQGNVLWHTNQYDGMPTMEGLRKKDPNYKPANDPGMPNSPVPLDTDWGPLTLLACLGGVGMFLTSLLGGALAIVHHLIESLTTAPAAAEE